MVGSAFWLFGAAVGYVYLGYPLLLRLLAALRPVSPLRGAEVILTVSVIIPAYNEERSIQGKLENTLSLAYPVECLDVIVASDGSTDRTNSIVRGFEPNGVRLISLHTNQGKSVAENAAVAHAEGEILLFTDANVMLRADALRQMVSHFVDPRVGCVVGRVTYQNQGETSVSEGEGAYWRYELILRQKESELGNLAMGSGPIMAIRRSLFSPLDPDVGEDFVLPMQVVLRGYRVVYEPAAVSEEVLFQNRPSSMFRSKVRIISKDLRGLFLCRAILNPFRYPLHAWGLISHKLLRWLVPYFLLAIVVSNLFLIDRPLYQATLFAQVAFYGLAVAGYFVQRRRKAPRLLAIPFSFCLVNLAALAGVARFVLGRKTGRWEPIRIGGEAGL